MFEYARVRKKMETEWMLKVPEIVKYSSYDVFIFALNLCHTFHADRFRSIRFFYIFCWKSYSISLFSWCIFWLTWYFYRVPVGFHLLSIRFKSRANSKSNHSFAPQRSMHVWNQIIFHKVVPVLFWKMAIYLSPTPSFFLECTNHLIVLIFCLSLKVYRDDIYLLNKTLNDSHQPQIAFTFYTNWLICQINMKSILLKWRFNQTQTRSSCEIKNSLKSSLHGMWIKCL